MRSNIATAINAAHAGVEAAKSEAVRCAAECGKLLAEAKVTVPHGKWDAWLKKHCAFAPRTAQLYMKLARFLETADPAEAQRVADLSLRQAGRLIADGETRKARRAVTPVIAAQAQELGQQWASASPQARESFAREIHDRGEITLEQRNAMIVAAWHNSSLTEKQRDEARDHLAAMLKTRLPPEVFREVMKLAREDQITGTELAIAIGDVRARAN